MIDHAKESLNYVLRSGEFARIPDVAVFKEHELRDKSGRLIRKVDRAELERIARVGNERAAKTGDLCPVGPGHTKDDAPEEDQPPIWGYLHNYAVKYHRAEGKWYLHADEYIRRRIETKDGKVVDGVRYAKSFPRRSPEYWQADHLIDWLALLRITPKLDMGMVAYGKRYEGDGCLAYANQKGKLRYSMERYAMDLENERPNAGDPTLPPDASVDIDNEPMPAEAHPEPDADDMPSEEKEKYSKALFGMPHSHVSKLFSHLHKKYAKEAGCEDEMPERYDAATPPAAPSGTDTYLPGPDDKEPTRMSKTQSDLAPSRYQREISDVRKQNAALQSRLAEIEQRERLTRYSKELSDLVHEGYDFDPTEELEDCKGMDDAAFAKHKDRIIKRYAKAPVGGELIRFEKDRLKNGGPAKYSKADVEKAVKLAQEKGIAYEDALAQVKS